MSKQIKIGRTDPLRKLVCAALFVALAYLMRFFLHFNVLFLTFELKDAIITIGGLFLGPLYALGMSLTVALLELVTISDTGLYGFLMNFLAVATLSVASSLIYKYRKTFRGAIFGLTLGATCMVAVMMLANLVITPLYMGATAQEVIALIPTLLLPFNLIKAVMNTAVVLLLYKPVTNALSRVGLLKKEVHTAYDRRSLMLAAFAVVLLVLGALAFVFFLHGNIDLWP